MSTSEGGSLRPRDRLGLSAHYFFSFAAIGFTVTFLPLFLKSRGLTLTQIGMLSAIYALCGASIQIPVGALSDRLGRRKPITITSALLLGVSYILYNSARDFTDFCVLYLVSGTLFYTIATLTSALISDWTAKTGSTGRHFGNTRIWGSIGFIVTLAVVSAIPGMTRGRNLLPIVALLFWTSGCFLGSVSEPEKHSHERRPLFKGIPTLFKNRDLVIFLVTLFLYTLCQSGGNGFLSLYLQELKASRSVIALAWAFSAIVEIPFMKWVGGASDRLGRRPPMVIAFLCLPVRLLLYSQLRNPSYVFYIQLLQGFTFSFMLVSSLAFVADLCPGNLRATGQGVLGMTTGLASAFGPFLGGWLADRISTSSMYIVLSGVVFVAGLIFILFVHESHPGLDAEHMDSRIGRRHPLLRPAVRMLSMPLLGAAYRERR